MSVTEKMSLCITHFKLIVIELEEEIAIHKDKLRNICDGNDLYFYKTNLSNLKIKFTRNLKRKSTKS